MREYLPVLMFLVVAIGFAAGTIGLSTFIVPRRHNPTKDAAYECGVEPVGDARRRFNIKFYLVAVLFIAILLAGYFYLLKKKALEWD